MRRSRLALGICLALFPGMAVPGLCDGTPPARRANAQKLVRMAAEACAGAVQALERTSSPEPRLLPLHDALTRMQSSLSEVGSRLTAHDLTYFQALSHGTRTLAELGVVWPRAGLRSAEIDARMRILSDSYGRLRNRYGREWLRFRTGSTLDAQERRRFAQVQAAQALLVSTLTPLLDRARVQGDAKTAGELSLLVAQANRIAQAPPTLDEMLNASVLSDTIEGEYDATRAANPADDPEWNGADQVVEQLQTDSSVGFVFTTNLDTVQGGWSWVEDETEIPDTAAGAGGGQTIGLPASGALGALDDALAAQPRIEPESPAAFEDEDEMLDGEAEILDGEAELEGDESALESAVDSPETLDLAAKDEEGAQTDAPACTAESAKQGCAEALPAVQPPPKPPPPTPPVVLPR